MEQSGNIYIVEAEDNFKRVHKSIIENKNIDCETLGIYTRIIVLGLKWKLNIKGLSTHLNLPDTRIRKSISLLEQEGYVVRTAVRGEGGKFYGWNYQIMPTPIEEGKRSSAGKPTSQKTDTRLNGQDGEPTTRLTDNTVNGGDNNNKPKERIDLNNYKTEQEEKKEWRDSFEVYLALVNTAKERLLNDTEYRQYIEKYYPNSDYEATINKLVDSFWGKSEGWEHNKKKKCKTINMFSALKKNMDKRDRIVYKQKQNNNSKKYVSSQERNETLKPDMPILNEDGYLMDGTFFKQNARWYISEIDAQVHSIPIKAPQRPDNRHEWDSVNNRWYLPIDKWSASDEIW